MSKADNTSFEYDDVFGEVTKETEEEKGKKPIEKTYQYDTSGNQTSFTIKMDNETKLGLYLPVPV